MNRPIQALLTMTALALTLALAGPTRAGTEFRGFSQAELDQMLAPVALYPDTVLSHVLIAATYPLEVVQAARWSRNHPDLRGERAVDAVVGRDWDPSVMALVAFPDLLARMDGDLDWTQMLGDAFLIQEEQVLDSIQRLRAQAHQSGHLGSNEHVRVVREREVIYIEPARRQVIYLPYYDPHVVYGSWRWASYPPVYWRHPPRHRRSVAFYWGPAYHVAPTFFFSSFHWSRRQLVVVNHHHHYYRPHHYRRPDKTVIHQHFYSGRDLARHDSARRWTHEPTHRRGVAYRHGTNDRHRQIGSGSRSTATSTRQAEARPASSRAQQREWAQSRRDSGLPSTRSGSSANHSAASSRQGRLENRSATPRLQSSAGTRTVQRSEASRRNPTTTRPSTRRETQSTRSAGIPARSPTAPTSSRSPSLSSSRNEGGLSEARRTVSRPASNAPRTRSTAQGPRSSASAGRQAAGGSSAPASRLAPATSSRTRATAPRSSSPQRSSGQTSSSSQARSTAPARSVSSRSARTESRGARSAQNSSSRASARSSNRHRD